MKRKTTILLSSILAGSLLVGGAFAAYAVVDNANAVKVQVTPHAPVIPDTEVELNWGEKVHADISGLQRDTLARLAYVTVKSDVDYTGIFSLLMEDATEEKVPNSKALFDYLEVYTYQGKVDLEQGEIPSGAVELEELRILPATEVDEDGNKGYKLAVEADSTGVQFSIFVKLVVEEDYLGEMTDDVVEFTLDWGMNDDGHSHPYTPAAVPATEPGYYLVGNMTDWGPYTNTKFSVTKTEGEYRLDNVVLGANDAFKAYEIKNEGAPVYIPDGPDMTAPAGTYDILFSPTYRSDWATGEGNNGMFGRGGHFWMIPHSEEPAPGTSEEPGTSEQPTSEQPEQQAEYFLVGVNGSDEHWDIDDSLAAFVANTAAEGEYMLSQPIHLAANSSLKVRSATAWYPDGMDNDYTVSAEGNYQVYFKPDGKGGQDWHYGYFYVAAQQ